MKGSVIMISANLTKTIEKILPVRQNLIPVSFKRKLVYGGHYIREYIDKQKLMEYFRFFKINNHLYEDLSLGDLEKVEEELCSAVGDKTDDEEDSEKPDLESEVPMSQHSLILDKYMESTDGKTVAKKVASMIHDFERLHNITEEEEENELAANDPEENYFPEDEREDFEEENSFLEKLHSLDVKLEDTENWAIIVELGEMFRSWKRKPRLHLADHFCSLVKQEAHLVSLKSQLLRLKLKCNNPELQDLIVSALDDVANSIEETTAKRVSTSQCCHQDDDVIDPQLDQILKSNADTESGSDRNQRFVQNQVKQIEKNLQDIINVAPGEGGNFHNWGSDIYLEEKLFPQLFPFGIGGYLSSNLLRKEGKKMGFSNYVKNRLLSIMPKYREDKDYLFFLLIVKEQLEMRRSERTYFRKAAKVPSLTPAVLSQQSPEMLSRYNSLYRTLKNVRGSACYFQDVQKRLMAFLRQKGAPTLFVTFSAAEFDWEHLALKIYETVTNKPSTLEFIRSQSHSWRNKLVQENVVQSTIYFSKRIEKIISYLNNNHLLEHEGVQYTVVSYFLRKEFQVIFLTNLYSIDR